MGRGALGRRCLGLLSKAHRRLMSILPTGSSAKSGPQMPRKIRILNPLDQSDEALQGGVVAIGNFDGVHRGHQVVLDQAKAYAETASLPVLAVTFEPHPRQFFQPETPLFRLTSAADKALLLNATGLSAILQIPFTAEFSKLSAEAFITDVLVDRLNVAHVVVGFDFHFGAKRIGSPAFLRDAGARRGFGVTIVDGHGDESGRFYASSQIRHHLTAGNLADAATALGHRWFVTGEICHGEKRGRELGYPTANMALDPACGLKHGIYTVQMVVDGVIRDGVASFGRRPTFDNGAPLLETFLFDFSDDLYGKRVAILFEAFQRPELKFDSVEALIAQMDQDSREARKTLGQRREQGPISALDQKLIDLLMEAPLTDWGKNDEP